VLPTIFIRKSFSEKSIQFLTWRNYLENPNLTIWVTSAFHHFKEFQNFLYTLVTFKQKWGKPEIMKRVMQSQKLKYSPISTSKNINAV
jgi:hypothetical protein